MNKRRLLPEAIIFSLGLMAFSFFIPFNFPVKLISFAALLIPAAIISGNISSKQDLVNIAGLKLPDRSALLFAIAGISGGVILASIYRWHLNISLFPGSIHHFAIVAAFIGSMEELVFRGFLQGHVKRLNGPLSVIFATLSHTGYKCCLFISPAIASEVDVGFLALWTFGAGLLFGIVRHFSDSVLPSLAAHAVFDVIVYAEFIKAPWWVW